MKNYPPKASEMKEWLEKNDALFESKEEKDEGVADYMAHQAYKEKKDVGWGRNILAAFLHLYRAMHGLMWNSARALA